MGLNIVFFLFLNLYIGKIDGLVFFFVEEEFKFKMMRFVGIRFMI